MDNTLAVLFKINPEVLHQFDHLVRRSHEFTTRAAALRWLMRIYIWRRTPTEAAEIYGPGDPLAEYSHKFFL